MEKLQEVLDQTKIHWQRVKRYFKTTSIIKFDDFFGISLFLLRLICLDFRSSENSDENISKFGLIKKYFFYWFLFFDIILLVTLTEVDMLSDKSNIQKIVFGLTILLTYFVFHSRVFVLWNQKSEFTVFLGKLKHSYPKISSSAEGICRSYKIFQTMFCGLNIVLCCVTLVPLAKYFISGDRTFIVPFPGFLTTKNVYPVALIWSNFAGFHGIYFVSTFALFSSALIFGVSVEFYTLADKISSFQSMSELEIKAEIGKVVEDHCTTFQLVSDLENILSKSFFIRFIVSASIIGMNIFQLRTTDDIFDSSIFLIYTCFELCQVFLQCYFGQVLIDASERVCDEIYACGWEKWENIAMKNKILVILHRAQKPAVLTIYKFGVISMEQFTMVR